MTSVLKNEEPKQKRHLSVVGGTNSLPSLREYVHHRNVQTKKTVVRRTQSTKPAVCVVFPREKRSSSTDANKSCNFCSKIQRHWKESDGLRKKTVYSDVTLHSSDGQYFYCNSFVLAMWSKSLLDKARLEKGSNDEEWIVYMEVFSGEILYSCLRFMYGGAVDDLPPRHLAEIVKMAEQYRMEDVKNSCFSAANKAPLKIDNACATWSFAEQHNLCEAAQRAMRFIYENLEKVVADRDWTRVSHRPEMLLALFEASAGWTTAIGDWRSIKSLKKEEETAISSFAKGVRDVWTNSDGLQKPSAYSDVVIVTKDGREFNVHTQFVYASSPSFANLLHDEAGTSEGNVIFLDDMDDDVVEEFLRFIYRQDATPAFSKVAPMLHVLASTYEVRELARLCEREMAAMELTSVNEALKMLRDAEEHRMTTAKSVCFRYLYEKLDEVRVHSEWRRLVFEEPQLLTEMMLESKRFRRLIDAKGKHQ